MGLWALNVAGGGLILELGTHGPIVGILLAEAAGLNFAFVEGTFDIGHIIVNLIQTVVEPGDPSTMPATSSPTRSR